MAYLYIEEKRDALNARFKFSVGPWNVRAGADSCDPAARQDIPIEEKFKKFAALGFSAIQLHDDDAVPKADSCTAAQIRETFAKYKLRLLCAAARRQGGGLAFFCFL